MTDTMKMLLQTSLENLEQDLKEKCKELDETEKKLSDLRLDVYLIQIRLNSILQVYFEE